MFCNDRLRNPTSLDFISLAEIESFAIAELLASRLCKPQKQRKREVVERISPTKSVGCSLKSG